MTNDPATLVATALSAATLEQAEHVHSLLGDALGGDETRPLGDRWNNHGLMGQSGSFDLKLIEQLTNMQDSVLERHALKRFTDPAAVPYDTPHEAAQELFGDASEKERAAMASVRFVESDGKPSTSKRLTPVFRDQGCGLTAELVPDTIFRLGGQLKEDRLWQQGAFGLGGATTFRNAKAVVLVSRRDPALLDPGAEDRIVVAVVLWKEMTKGLGAYYRVGTDNLPWSCPAAAYPGFEPGTHLALVSYGTEGIHRKHQGDERTFDTIAETRLFRPVLPLTFCNETDRGRVTTIRGLKARLDNRPPEDAIPMGQQIVPFGIGDQVYDLPISYYLFRALPGEKGGRRSFVAYEHVVAFTSNGQVHHHWNGPTFKARTGLNKLHDRVLVVVETDALPIRVRTSLFTADRADLVRTDAAVQLEETVAGALKGWEELREENSKLIRDALKSSDQPTRAIAKKISRALDVRGFRTDGGTGSGGGTAGANTGGGGKPGKPKHIELHQDPTYVHGPAARTVEIGRTSFITVYVDAVDEFWEHGRGHLEAECDHDDIGSQQIRVGKGRNGRVQVSVAVPESAVPGTTEELRLNLSNWHRASGGLGPTLSHTVKLELVTDLPGRGNGSGKKGAGDQGAGGPSQGNLVALQWSNPEAQSDWKRRTVGEVMAVAASDLAASDSEYSELASLGDQPVPTIVLNEHYPPLQTYLASRSKKLGELDRPREQYATGVGLDLLLLNQELERLQSKDLPTPDDDFVATAHEAAARAVLAIMPAFDDLAKEAGLGGEE